MNGKLYERSHFRDEEAYEEYLEKIRSGKNYLMYKQIADMLWNVGVSAVKGDIRDIINLVDKQINERNGYHYEWYAENARRAIELVLMETESIK